MSLGQAVPDAIQPVVCGPFLNSYITSSTQGGGLCGKAQTRQAASRSFVNSRVSEVPNIECLTKIARIRRSSVSQDIEYGRKLTQTAFLAARTAKKWDGQLKASDRPFFRAKKPQFSSRPKLFPDLATTAAFIARPPVPSQSHAPPLPESPSNRHTPRPRGLFGRRCR